MLASVPERLTVKGCEMSKRGPEADAPRFVAGCKYMESETLSLSQIALRSFTLESWNDMHGMGQEDREKEKDR